MMPRRSLRRRKKTFDNKVIRDASVATAPIAAWVKANVKYSEVLLKIEPLEMKWMYYFMIFEYHKNEFKNELNKLKR